MNEECPPICEVMTENEYQLYLKHNLYHHSLQNKVRLHIKIIFSSPGRNFSWHYQSWIAIRPLTMMRPMPAGATDNVMYPPPEPGLCLANFRLNNDLSDMEETQYFKNIQHYSTHFKIFSLNVKMIKLSLIEKQ